MLYLFISLLLYSQNFIFAFLTRTEFIPSALEFIFLFSLVLLISKLQKLKNIIFIIIQLSYFIHFSFINYFKRDISSNDIFLFLTHKTETFDTLINTLYILTIPMSITIIVFLLIYRINLKELKTNTLTLTLFSAILLFITHYNFSDKAFIFFKELVNLSTLKHNYRFTEQKGTPKALKDSDINIVFLIGESLRAKEYLDIDLKLFRNYNYKSIYSLATNTDVSIPLLLNGSNNPLKIVLSNNLFNLAKNNGYTTSFISTQSEKSLQYIKPFLSKQNIDYLNIIGSKDDKNLLEEIYKHEFKKKSFLVLQMQGSHSPYKFYPNFEKEKPYINYYMCCNYSDKILDELINYIKTLNKKTIFIFSSDHGEFIGLDGKLGHNSFEKEIYRVPFIYFANFDIDIDMSKINSHLDIYTLISWLLGYKTSQANSIKPVIVNGTMITREDGFITIKD